MEKSILHIAGHDALVLVFWLSTYCQVRRLGRGRQTVSARIYPMEKSL